MHRTHSSDQNSVNVEICNLGSISQEKACPSCAISDSYTTINQDDIQNDNVSQDFNSNLRAFFDLSGDMFWVLDLQGNIIETNAHQYLGYQKEELLGHSVLIVHPPELHQRAMEIVMAMLEGRKSVCPLPLIKKDGTRIPVETRATLGAWNGQKAIFASSRDMSTLMLSEEKFSKAFHESPALMAISTITEGQFIDVNTSFLQTLGFNREEVIGKTSRDLHLYNDYSIRDTAAQDALKIGEEISTEQRTRTKDGRWLDGVYSVRILSIGKEKLLFTVMIDMTAQKESQRKLQHLIAMEDFLVQSASKLLTADPRRTNEALNSVMTAVGKLAESDRSYIFQFNLRKRIMDNIVEWCAPGIAPQIQELQNLPFSFFPDLIELFKKGEPFVANDVSDLDDSHKMTRDVLESQNIKSALLIPILSKHKMMGFLGLDSVSKMRVWPIEYVNILIILSNNIASAWEKKAQFTNLNIATQKAREYANQAKRANSYKDEFISTMSHEIRTPMNGVINAVRFLSETNLDQRQQRYIAMLRNSSEILLKIINDILDYSKISSGKAILEHNSFDLRETIDYCIAPYLSAAEIKGLDFKVTYNSDIPSFFLGDQRKINQILANILSNAIKFTKNGGIQFIVEAITEKNFSRIFFTIKDTGIGMSEEFIKKQLFNAFQQGNPAISREFGGSGLGLRIAKQLSNMMGGEIDISSKENSGATIVVSIVLEIDQKRINQVRSHNNSLIYILGNKAGIAYSLEEIFHGWGMSVTCFESPEDIQLESIRRSRVCVCLDLDLFGQLLDKIMSYKEKPTLFVTEQCWQERIMDSMKGYLLSARILKIPLDPSSIYENMNIKIIQEDKSNELIGLENVSFKNTSVLVVEDNDLNIEIISEYLRRLGITAHIAKDPHEFYFKIDNGILFDLIFMDVQLGDTVDGYQLTRAVRTSKNFELRNIPIIAMTAHVLEKEKKRSFESGMNDRLDKPIDPHELEKILKKWISSNKQMFRERSVSKNSIIPILPTPRGTYKYINEYELSEFIEKIMIPVQDHEPDKCNEIVREYENYIWPNRIIDYFNKIVENIEDFKFKETEIILQKLKAQMKIMG